MVLLADDCRLDAGVFEEVQDRFGIDTEHHQAGTPVPAAMALGLPQHVEVGDLVVGDAVGDGERLFCRAECRLFHRGAEVDGDIVPAGLQHLRQIETVADEGGFEFGDEGSVDRNIGDGIDEFEVEDRPLAGEFGGIDIEAPADLPLRLGHPLNVGFIRADHRIGDAAERVKRRVDIAWNRAGTDHGAVAVMERPQSGERRLCHPEFSPGCPGGRSRQRRAAGSGW